MPPSQRSVIALYFALLLICVALMLGSNLLRPVVSETVLPLAGDGFKTVLGALVGALSVMVGERRPQP
jgi:hypothetical protein